MPGDTFLLAPSAQRESNVVQTPFYNLSAEQPPEFLYLLRVYQSNDQHRWSALPPVPAPGTSAQRQGLLQALAVTDDGRLLAFGVDPKTGMPSQANNVPGSKIPAFWLWIWNPGSARWQVLSLPLNFVAEEGCGLCWRAFLATGVDHATYLTVAPMAEINDPNSGYHLFRVRIPDAQ